MKKYTKEQILIAAELGEVSMIDVRHVISYLDEAVVLERERKMRMRNVSGELAVYDCRCIRFTDSNKWYSNGCKIHTNE